MLDRRALIGFLLAVITSPANAWLRHGSAPGAAPALDLVAASDTGGSSTDNITSDATPDLDITFPSTPVAGDQVRLYDNGVLLATHTLTTNEANGITPYPLGIVAPLSVGLHPLTAVTIQGGVTSAASTVLNLTVV